MAVPALRIRWRRVVVTGAVAALAIGLGADPANAVGVRTADERGTPRACSAALIEDDTGIAVSDDVQCAAGFAVGPRADTAPPTTAAAEGSAPQMPVTSTTSSTPTSTSNPAATVTTPAADSPSEDCDDAVACDLVAIFHVTTSGWVYDGDHGYTCAEDLDVLFLAPHTATAFAPQCSRELIPPPPVLAGGDAAVAVMSVQIALVALGYPVAVDGTFGLDTEEAVRDFQQLNSLPTSGAVGAIEHARLGTGPTDPAESGATSTVPAPTTTSEAQAGWCSAASITADTGLEVFGEPRCGAGWAVTTACSPQVTDPDAECEDVDTFHLTPAGWLADGTRYAGCAESLAAPAEPAAALAMSPQTALAFAPWCAGAPPERSPVEPGSVGLAVSQLQIALVYAGAPVEIDGTYGPRTVRAVEQVQGAAGLPVDGVADPATQVALGM